MKPVIGITCKSGQENWHYVPDEYVQAIESTGGVPLLIPLVESKEAMRVVADKIDGLLLTGGKDIDPVWYGEEPLSVKEIDPRKDLLEVELTKRMLAIRKPILGICRGAQLLNVVAGGTLNQDAGTLKHFQEAPKDYPTHEIEIKNGTLLFRLIGRKCVRVNSFHHQSIRDVAREFRISAVAKDGVIEAIEKGQFILGVQFHIEHLWQKERGFKNIFSAFVQECQKVS